MKTFWTSNWKWFAGIAIGAIAIFATMKVDAYRLTQVEAKAEKNAASVQQINETLSGLKKDVEYIVKGVDDLRRQQQTGAARP